jgi:signal transduction histidine kinase
MEIVRNLNLRRFLFLFAWVFSTELCAQEGFDQQLNIDEIHILLEKGTSSRNIREQALAWYLWGRNKETIRTNPGGAFKYLEQSADLFLKSSDSLAYFRVRTEIAIWLSTRGFDDEARPMLEEAYQYWERTKNLKYATLSLAYLYQIEPTKKNSDKKEKKPTDYLNAFEEKNQKLKDTTLQMMVLVKKAERLHRSRYFQAAAKEGRDLLNIAERANNDFYAAYANYIIGLEELTDKRNYVLAETYLKKAESFKLPAVEGPDLRRKIYYSFVKLYNASGKPEEGNEYALRYGELSDTLLSEKRWAAMNRVNKQFDTEEKEGEITKLQGEKQVAEEKARTRLNLMIGSSLIVVSLVSFGFYYYKNTKLRLRNERTIAAQSEEISQRKIKELENSLLIVTMKGMIEGVESERNRVAKDLHDSVGGLIASIKMGLQGLSSKYESLAESTQFARINRLIDETAIETRNISHNLQPATLFQFGFEKAVQDLCVRFSIRNEGPQIAFQAFGDFSKLNESMALNGYRIIQELLQNSIKHANATEISVQITLSEQDEVMLLVEDNGKGYDPDAVRKGMGTDNLNYRVKFLDGEHTIHSGQGTGTSNMVSFPCKKQ